MHLKLIALCSIFTKFSHKSHPNPHVKVFLKKMILDIHCKDRTLKFSEKSLPCMCLGNVTNITNKIYTKTGNAKGIFLIKVFRSFCNAHGSLLWQERPRGILNKFHNQRHFGKCIIPCLNNSFNKRLEERKQCKVFPKTKIFTYHFFQWLDEKTAYWQWQNWN